MNYVLLASFVKGGCCINSLSPRKTLEERKFNLFMQQRLFKWGIIVLQKAYVLFEKSYNYLSNPKVLSARGVSSAGFEELLENQEEKPNQLLLLSLSLIYS